MTHKFNDVRASKNRGSYHFQNKQANEKFKRPERTAKRKTEKHNKDKESKVIGYRVLVNNYDDLTKFKTFITFLRKKDLKFEINGEKELTNKLFDIDDNIIDYAEKESRAYGLFHSRTALRNMLKSVGEVKISFTDRRITIKIEKDIMGSQIPIRKSTQFMAYNSVTQPLFENLDNSWSFQEKLKIILKRINMNIKLPEYKRIHY